MSKDFGFMVWMVILSLGITTIFGEKVLMWFLIVILLGMLVNNADRITHFLGGVVNANN